MERHYATSRDGRGMGFRFRPVAKTSIHEELDKLRAAANHALFEGDFRQAQKLDDLVDELEQQAENGQRFVVRLV